MTTNNKCFKRLERKNTIYALLYMPHRKSTADLSLKCVILGGCCLKVFPEMQKNLCVKESD